MAAGSGPSPPQRFAFGEAARWYAQALDALDQHPGPDRRQRCELLVGLGRAREADHANMGLLTLAEAGELAVSIGALDLLVEAVQACGFVVVGAVNERIVAIAERGLQLVGGDGAARAVLLAAIAHQLQWERPPDRFLRLAAEALAIAQRIDDAGTLLYVVRQTDFVDTADRVGDLLDVTGEALAAAAAAGDPLAESGIATFRTSLALKAGHIDIARAAFEHLRSAATRAGWLYNVWVRTVQESRLTLLAGDPSASERMAEEALAFGKQYFAAFGTQLYSIRHHQGRVGELATRVERAPKEQPTVASFHAVVPWVLAHAGDHDHARLADFRSRVEVPWDNLWLNCMWLLGEAAAACHDEETAEDAYRQLLPWAHLVSGTGVTCDGPIAHTLGLLAETLGHPDDAVAHFDAALAMGRRLAAPFHIARAELALGRLRGERALVEDALALARRHGYAAVEADAAAALQRLGF